MSLIPEQDGYDKGVELLNVILEHPLLRFL